MSLYFGDLKIPNVNYTTVIANIALETKTVTPSKNSQTITPSNGNQGFSSVTINPIPNEYIIPANTLQISTSGEHNVTQYAKVNVTFPSYTLETRVVTPTASQQSITPSTGYDGLGQVTINAISTQTKTVTSNGTYTPDSGKFFSSFTVNIPTGATINSEEITISPSETEQIITPSNGHNAIVQVTVNPISSTYVGSEIPRNSQNSLTASGATISVPAGYYATSVSKSVASGTAGSPTATKGTVSNHQVSVTPTVTNTTGYITGGTKTGTAITVKASDLVSGDLPISENGTKDVTNYKTVSVSVVSDAPTEMSLPTSASSTQVGTNKATINRSTSAQYINIPIGYNSIAASYTISATPNMTLPTAVANSASGSSNKLTFTPTTANKYINIPTGYNTTASYYTLKGDSNLKAENIKSGVTIFGISGSYTASTGLDTSDATASAADILSNKTAYVNGSKITGTIPVLSSPFLFMTDVTSNNNFYKITASIDPIEPFYTDDGQVKLLFNKNMLGQASTSQVLEDVTFSSANGMSLTGTMANNGQTSGTITSQGGTYIIPAGYTTGGTVTANISSGSTTVSGSASASSATITTGNGTLTLTKSVSITPSVSAGYISSGTQGSVNISLTASVTTKAAATITPSTSNQTIASGTYLTGTQTIAGDADLVAGNIKSGVNIFGVTGTYSGLNTSDANASASDINSGKTAYVNGTKITGTQVINKYYTGSSAPASSLGSNGDIYFQE